MDTVKMNPPMPEANPCPQCGTPLPTGALAGLCPACLLAQGAADSATGGQTPPFQPPPVAELAAKFPQLEILELIGKGGMGAVYKARQKQLDRLVALKILPPGIGADPAFAGRFAREARALAKLNHPNIVTLYEFGDAGGQFYFLMEFVDGVNLRQLLHVGRISAREALAIVPQICDALQFAHDQGIVHRDIKPENILLDRRGRVKVADFGLAKIVGMENEPGGGGLPSGAASTTEAGKIMGTPDYMSPEQKEHPGEVDNRADIYALGVVFYQMLTGELPGKRIAPPSTKVQIDVRLDEIVLRALEKSPGLRYQQVSEVKTCVETIVGTLPDGGGSGPAQTESERGQTSQATPTPAAMDQKPRFARIALGGTVCAAVALVSLILALVIHGKTKAAAPEISRLMDGATAAQVSSSTVIQSWSGLIHLNRYVFTPLVYISVFGAMIFGWLAILQMRRTRLDPALLRAVESWLALMDGGSYAQSWDAAAKYFQKAITKEEWIDRLQNARKPQGKVISRKVRTVRCLGSRYMAKFDTTFAGLKAAVETVTFSQERDGQWRAIGYLILPAYYEKTISSPLAGTALFFAGMSGVLGFITFCLWPNPPLILVLSILASALAGIILGISSRKNRAGKQAIVVGGINAAIWLIIAAALCYRAVTSSISDRLAPAIQTGGDAAQLTQAGWQLWQARKLDEAAAKFQLAVQLAPGDADAWNGLGWATFNSGNSPAAEKAFQKVLSLEPSHPAALNGLGQIYLSQGKYDDAEKYLLKAAPQAPAAWFGLARLYLLQGKFEDAGIWAQKIVDSGQADETAKKMLEAAVNKNLSEGLRLLLEPPTTRPSGPVPVLQASPNNTADYPGDWIWEPNSQTLDRVPPIFLLRPSTLPAGAAPFGMSGKDRYLARGLSLQELIVRVWSQKNSALKIIFEAGMPVERFDFIVTSQAHWWDPLESEINQRFNLVEQIETHDGGDVVVVKNTRILTQADLTLTAQPPVVVETFPTSGARDVEPGETEIRVRFSKEMAGGSWSWSTAWENSTPEFLGQPHYEADARTCVVKTKLEPGRTYAFWLNSDNFQNFKDHDGHPAVPYLLIFQTKQK
jgi:tetratricopeptide (TPR) repeat protein/predicted Ser/Thr protein kinase